MLVKYGPKAARLARAAAHEFLHGNDSREYPARLAETVRCVSAGMNHLGSEGAVRWLVERRFVPDLKRD